MEVVDLLKEKIKTIATEENIDVQKLNEYVRIYERLRAFDVTTVAQVGNAIADRNYMFEPQIAIPRMGVVPPIANEIGGIFDMVREVAGDINKPKGRHEIDEYICWIRFLKDFKNNINEYVTDRLCETWDTEINNLVYNLHQRVFTLMKKQLIENIEKETKEIERKTRKKDTVVDNVVDIIT